MTLNKIVIVAFCLLAVLGSSVYAVLTTRTADNAQLALAELQVKNMTCGSCVGTITDALEGVSGVEKVDVSVTTGIGKVTFNPSLVDAEKLASTVTATGYPATVKQLLSSDQYHALQNEETRLATSYVARIGETLISRSEFGQQIAQYLKSKGMQDRPEARSQAIGQTWQATLQKTLLLQAAEKNQVVVQDGEIELRIERVQKGIPNFDEYVQTRYGSRELYRQRLKEEMIISRNIDQFVLSKVNNKMSHQQAFNRWFQSLVDNASITIFDPQIKQIAGSAGGCAGSCCG